MSNKSLGNSFETELCNLLSVNGFWVHNFASKSEGQPADIIAVKDQKAYLIDCKVCTNNTFPLSRIEGSADCVCCTGKTAGACFKKETQERAVRNGRVPCRYKYEVR